MDQPPYGRNQTFRTFRPKVLNLLPSQAYTSSPTLFEAMKSWPERFSIIDFYLSLIDKDLIHAVYDKNLRLIDVGKIDNLRQATEFLRSTDK